MISLFQGSTIQSTQSSSAAHLLSYLLINNHEVSDESYPACPYCSYRCGEINRKCNHTCISNKALQYTMHSVSICWCNLLQDRIDYSLWRKCVKTNMTAFCIRLLEYKTKLISTINTHIISYPGCLVHHQDRSFSHRIWWWWGLRDCSPLQCQFWPGQQWVLGNQLPRSRYMQHHQFCRSSQWHRWYNCWYRRWWL